MTRHSSYILYILIFTILILPNAALAGEQAIAKRVEVEFAKKILLKQYASDVKDAAQAASIYEYLALQPSAQKIIEAARPTRKKTQAVIKELMTTGQLAPHAWVKLPQKSTTSEHWVDKNTWQNHREEDKAATSTYFWFKVSFIGDSPIAGSTVIALNTVNCALSPPKGITVLSLMRDTDTTKISGIDDHIAVIQDTALINLICQWQKHQ